MKIAHSLILVLALWNTTAALAHGGHMAVFTYQFEADAVSLEFRIEQSVLDHFDLKSQCPQYESAVAFCLSEYLEAHTRLEWGGQALHFELEGATTDRADFVLRMRASTKGLTPADLSIWNDCFTAFDRQFENRIIIRKGGQDKSYRLDHRNTSVRLQ